MTPSQISIVNPRTLTIIALGAMLNRVSPELYLEDLLDRQTNGLTAELVDTLYQGADSLGAAMGEVSQ